MALQLAGADGSIIKVDREGAALVTGGLKSEFAFYAALGQAYVWTVITVNGAAADTILGIRNTSATKGLHIERMSVSGDVAGLVTAHVVTGSAALAGLLVTGVNLNGRSGNSADADARNDETTNSSQGTVIEVIEVPAASAEHMSGIHWGGALILANNEMLGIDMAAEMAAYQCSVYGYFKE